MKKFVMLLIIICLLAGCRRYLRTEISSASQGIEDKVKFLAGKKIVFLGMMPFKEMNDYRDLDFRNDRNLLKMQLFMNSKMDLGRIDRLSLRYRSRNLPIYGVSAPDFQNLLSSELEYSAELNRLKLKTEAASVRKTNLREFIERNYELYGLYSFGYLQNLLLFSKDSSNGQVKYDSDVKLKKSDADFFVVGLPDSGRIISWGTVLQGIISFYTLGLFPVDEKIRTSLRIYVYDRNLNLLYYNMYIEYKNYYYKLFSGSGDDIHIESETSPEVFYSALIRFTEDLYDIVQKEKIR